MKPIIVVSAVAIISGVGSAVGAAMFLPAIPPMPKPQPVPVIERIELARLASAVVVRSTSIEQRMRAEALIRVQA